MYGLSTFVPPVRGRLRTISDREAHTPCLLLQGSEGKRYMPVASAVLHTQGTLVNMSSIPSSQGDQGPGAASPQGAVSLMGSTPSIIGRVRCSLPVVSPSQTGVAGRPPQTDSLQLQNRACVSGRIWHVGEMVYLWDVMWECGLGQEGAITERSVKGSCASSSTTLP